MICPECEKPMTLEYSERGFEEWYCGRCRVYIEVDDEGNKIVTQLPKREGD